MGMQLYNSYIPMNCASLRELFVDFMHHPTLEKRTLDLKNDVCACWLFSRFLKVDFAVVGFFLFWHVNAMADTC
jgi:hypothetical protein